MAKYLIDEYGDLIGEFNDDDSIRVYNPLNTKRRFIENKLFYKFYKDSISIFLNGLISKQVTITLFKLIRLLDFGTNEFVNINGLPANELEILKKVKNGRNRNILINPYFIGYGTNCTDESLKIFSKTIWAKHSTYSKKKLKPKS